MQTSETNLIGALRLLRVLYGLFAIAASARALFQITTKWAVAPLAYSLSLLAAVLYGVALIGLNRRTPQAWWLTVGVCTIELTGVIWVGVASWLHPALFPAASVWSGFGAGYGYLPLVLPVVGLLWLLQPATRRWYRHS